jgi:hypothetical protein
MQPLKPHKALDPLTARYVWWEDAKWAYDHPTIFLANLMNRGTWDDIQTAKKLLGDEVFKQVLRETPPGYFNYRAWDYWHLKYGMTPIPPLPKRRFL